LRKVSALLLVTILYQSKENLEKFCEMQNIVPMSGKVIIIIIYKDLLE
jgi:hypothetical protein